MAVDLAAGTIRRDDSCSPSKNYTKPTDPAHYEYNWRIENDKYGNVELSLTQTDRQTFVYRKVAK